MLSTKLVRLVKKVKVVKIVKNVKNVKMVKMANMVKKVTMVVMIVVNLYMKTWQCSAKLDKIKIRNGSCNSDFSWKTPPARVGWSILNRKMSSS